MDIPIGGHLPLCRYHSIRGVYLYRPLIIIRTWDAWRVDDTFTPSPLASLWHKLRNIGERDIVRAIAQCPDCHSMDDVPVLCPGWPPNGGQQFLGFLKQGGVISSIGHFKPLPPDGERSP